MIQLAVLAALVFRGVALFGYNKLRALSESVKEAWSNIGIVVRKQASLVNQLIDVVKAYQESEKLVMLKVSEDSNLATVQSMYQQSGMVLSTVAGMVQRFPELKSNEQYHRLIDSVQLVENQLGQQRAQCNAAAKIYNVQKTSIPHVFYAKWLGFGPAPYLELGSAEAHDIATLKPFVSDDGERLNALLSGAGTKAISLGRDLGAKAIEHGRQLVEVAQNTVNASGASEYHYLDSEKNPQGPVTVEELSALFFRGLIGADTKVLRSGEKGWRLLADVIATGGR